MPGMRPLVLLLGLVAPAAPLRIRRAPRMMAHGAAEPYAPSQGAQDAGFAGLGVPDSLVEGLEGMGIEQPSGIQAAALPELLRGRSGLLHAETGSGKTLAFLLPALSAVDFFEARPQAIVLAPTRELAVQIAAEALKVLRVDPEDAPDVAALLVGRGDFQDVSLAELDTPIIVATAAEAKKALEKTTQRGLATLLEGLRVLVLDEVDRMLKPPSRHAPMSRKGRVSNVKTTRQELAGGGAGNYRHDEPAAIVLKTLSNGRLALPTKPSQPLQVIGASATIGRTLRRSLPSLLHMDMDDLPVVRAAEDAAKNVGGPNAAGKPSRHVVMPKTLRHFMLPVVDEVADAKGERPRLDVQLAAVKELLSSNDDDANPAAFAGVDRCLLVLPPGASVNNAVKRLRKMGAFAVALHEEMGFRSGNDGDLASVGALVDNYAELKDGGAGGRPQP
mmetsp:Transcript_33584/g.106138  ORF Transcript_33584/g.106138 Transcript_33584/m.106138 type:complete len:446 (-) Transcript_33584:38-1375(-)